MAMAQDQHQAVPARGGARRDLEDDHYGQLVTSGTRVHISCEDGHLIEDAQVKNFGTYALLVESEAGEDLVFKHAIVTIYPSRKP